MALFWKNKLLLAELASSYGYDDALTTIGGAGANDAILAYDVSLSPMEGTDQDRELERTTMGQSGSLATDLHMRLSFKVEFSGSGSPGGRPNWAKLMRACGVAETITTSTSVHYSPVSSSFESLTASLNIDGVVHKIKGARGTFKLMMEAQRAPYLEFEFVGLFAEPADVAIPTTAPNMAGFKKPALVNAANTVVTINSVVVNARTVNFDLGQELQPRFLTNANTVEITDRKESCEIICDAEKIATFNPYDLAAAGTKFTATFTHGITAGNIATLSIGSAQMQRVQSLQNTQGIAETSLRVLPLIQNQNDQWGITLT